MEHQMAYLTGNPNVQVMGDLSIISFYYLLRSREYTKPRKVKQNGKLVRATRTQEFRVQDLGFRKNGKFLSRHDSLNTLLEADSATLKIKKTKDWGKPLHHELTVRKGAVEACSVSHA